MHFVRSTSTLPTRNVELTSWPEQAALLCVILRLGANGPVTLAVEETTGCDWDTGVQLCYATKDRLCC